ncbi:MAG: energy transducer TonB [Muribaculaceae bacterium]|nr:energy transducer TonB [Muribaculaceae bacterium]
MNNPDKKDKILGVVGTLFFHVAIILILFFTKLYSPVSDEGGGILVAYGNNYEIVTEKPSGYIPPKVTSSAEEITQDSEEPSISSEDDEKKRKEEQRIEEERKAKEEAERKETDRINSLVSGALSASSSQNSSDSKGSPNGNSTEGAESGNAGYGSFDLGGRGLAKGESLPRPQYDNTNIEGKLVVDITVNPAGRVINASINLQKSDNKIASNLNMRNRALEAARKATFESIKENNNQNGTIIYYFKINR